MSARELLVEGLLVDNDLVVSSPSITVGRTNPLQQADPPTCSVNLLGAHDIRPGERVQIKVAGETRFQGIVDDAQVDGIQGVTKITGTSDVSRLAQHKLSGVWPAESFLNRMVRLYGAWMSHGLTLYTPADRDAPMAALNVDGKSVLDVTQLHAQGLGMSLDIGRDGISGITARDRDVPSLVDVTIPDKALVAVQWVDASELRVLGIEMKNETERKSYDGPITHTVETPLAMGAAWDDVAARALARWGRAIWHPVVTVQARTSALEDQMRRLSAGSSTVTIPLTDVPGTRSPSRWLVEGWTESIAATGSVWQLLLAPLSRAGWIGRTWADWDGETWAQIEARTWLTNEIGDK